MQNCLRFGSAHSSRFDLTKSCHKLKLSMKYDIWYCHFFCHKAKKLDGCTSTLKKCPLQCMKTERPWEKRKFSQICKAPARDIHKLKAAATTKNINKRTIKHAYPYRCFRLTKEKPECWLNNMLHQVPWMMLSFFSLVKTLSKTYTNDFGWYWIAI